jgi:hypothetical protein
VRVKNLGGTARGDQGSNWLAFWERSSAQNAFMCFGAGCINTPSVGGLVQKEDAGDGKWYVVPLCRQCGKAPELDIWELALLVCANESDALKPAPASGVKFVRWPSEWIANVAHVTTRKRYGRQQRVVPGLGAVTSRSNPAAAG